MKKIVNVLFLLTLFLDFKLYGMGEVQEVIQNLDHKLTTTTSSQEQPSDNLRKEITINDTQLEAHKDAGSDMVVTEINLQDLDLDQVDNEDGLNLTFSEKLSLLSYLIKIKVGEHFKNYGKWYLVGIVGTAGVISAYYFLNSSK